jgi:hypothetical protein
MTPTRFPRGRSVMPTQLIMLMRSKICAKQWLTCTAFPGGRRTRKEPYRPRSLLSSMIIASWLKQLQAELHRCDRNRCMRSPRRAST